MKKGYSNCKFLCLRFTSFHYWCLYGLCKLSFIIRASYMVDEMIGHLFIELSLFCELMSRVLILPVKFADFFPQNSQKLYVNWTDYIFKWGKWANGYELMLETIFSMYTMWQKMAWTFTNNLKLVYITCVHCFSLGLNLGEGWGYCQPLAEPSLLRSYMPLTLSNTFSIFILIMTENMTWL